MRWWVGLAAASATLLVSAPAPAQTPAPAPELAGVNQISGDRSGYLDVRIPDPVRISFDSRPSRNTTFAITSEGFAGVMLRRLDAGEDPTTLVAAARFEPGMLCGCEAPAESLTVGIDGVEPQASTDYSWEIPAGSYRLYLLTDGRPADVRITLSGRDGNRVLHPEHGVENPVPEAIPPLGAIASGPFQSFGRGDLLRSKGAQLWGGVVYITSNGDVEVEGCSHSGSDPITTVFTPGCPGGTSGGGYGYTYALTEGTSVYGAGFVAERDAGDWSVGGSVLSAGNVGAVGWASVVLPFQGDGTHFASPADPTATPAQSQDAVPTRRPSGRPRLLTRSARVRRGRVAVRIGCSGSGACTGSIRMGRARPSLFSVSAGRSTSVRLAVPPALARRVLRRGRAVARVAIGDERARLTLRR
jgi:hypothetical protein